MTWWSPLKSMIHEGIEGFDFNMKRNYIKLFYEAKLMAALLKLFTAAQICLNLHLAHKNFSIYQYRRLSD